MNLTRTRRWTRRQPLGGGRCSRLWGRPISSRKGKGLIRASAIAAYLLSSCGPGPRCPPRPQPSAPIAVTEHARPSAGGSLACPSCSASPSASGKGQAPGAVGIVLVRRPSR
ncbi:hypothetical protein CGRA01v4_01044 [Colletotrichum graminicola]|nr:hypothetical protein CGRA01v4_01044 [Colletotrichum graminicola]